MGFEALVAVNIKIPISSQQMMLQAAGCSKTYSMLHPRIRGFRWKSREYGSRIKN